MSVCKLVCVFTSYRRYGKRNDEDVVKKRERGREGEG